jgi:hypothetical protein
MIALTHPHTYDPNCVDMSTPPSLDPPRDVAPDASVIFHLKNGNDRPLSRHDESAAPFRQCGDSVLVTARDVMATTRQSVSRHHGGAWRWADGLPALMSLQPGGAVGFHHRPSMSRHHVMTTHCTVRRPSSPGPHVRVLCALGQFTTTIRRRTSTSFLTMNVLHRGLVMALPSLLEFCPISDHPGEVRMVIS